MKKKLMALLLTTAMLTAAFAGCGSKADSASAASTPDSTPKTETQAPAEPADNETDAPEAEASEAYPDHLCSNCRSRRRLHRQKE